MIKKDIKPGQTVYILRVVPLKQKISIYKTKMIMTSNRFFYTELDDSFAFSNNKDYSSGARNNHSEIKLFLFKDLSVAKKYKNEFKKSDTFDGKKFYPTCREVIKQLSNKANLFEIYFEKDYVGTYNSDEIPTHIINLYVRGYRETLKED